jgi:aryl-alcohol dehydrogenase-like predicted oxidoreductase
MQYRSLGRSGVQVSAIGVGCNQFGGKVDGAGTRAIVRQALEVGINFFDTANIYGQHGGSESVLGEALAGEWQNVVLASKGAKPMGDHPNEHGTARYHLQNAVEASLRRLKTDHIDLYQIHEWDDRTPVQEMMRTLEDLVRAGKVRYIGASNFAAWQLCRANDVAEMFGWEAFITVQPHYNFIERAIERELIPYCRFAQVGILPYFPLAGGFLTGKYQRAAGAPPGSRGERSTYVQKFFNDKHYTMLEALTAFATARGHTINELAHAWLLGQPPVCSVISGATVPAQIVANARAAEWTLTPEELTEVRQIVETSGATKN